MHTFLWASTQKFLAQLLYKLVKMVSVYVCLHVNQGSTNCNCCTQRLEVLHAQSDRSTNEPWSQTKKLGQSDLLYGQNRPPKMWAWISIIKAAEPHSPWNVCFLLYSMLLEMLGHSFFCCEIQEPDSCRSWFLSARHGAQSRTLWNTTVAGSG